MPRNRCHKNTHILPHILLEATIEIYIFFSRKIRGRFLNHCSLYCVKSEILQNFSSFEVRSAHAQFMRLDFEIEVLQSHRKRKPRFHVRRLLIFET